jgi:hypothetical protein
MLPKWQLFWSEFEKYLFSVASACIYVSLRRLLSLAVDFISFLSDAGETELLRVQVYLTLFAVSFILSFRYCVHVNEDACWKLNDASK